MEQSIEELIRQAVDLFKSGQIERAEIEFRKILELFPDHQLVIGTMADFYLQIGQPELALPLLRRLISKNPFDYMAHFLLGVAYAKVGRFWHSYEELKQADKLKPDDPEIIRQLGWCLGMKGEIEKSRELLKKSIFLDSDSPMAYADLGASYIFNGQYEEARKWLEKSLRIDPKYSLAHQLFKDLESNQNDFEKLSSVEKEKRRKELQSEEYRRQMQIDLMMNCLSQMEESKEDLAEVMQEFKEMGLSGQITMFHDPNTPEGRAAIEYVERHQKVKNIDRQKFTVQEINQMTDKLSASETTFEEKKNLILALAHQGSNEALEGLKKYGQKPDKELKIWIQMAIDECKAFLSGKVLDEPTVQIHQIGKANRGNSRI